MTTSPPIRLATTDDAAALAELGARAFAHSFAHSCSPADMAAYLAATYGAAQQAAELCDPAVRILVADAAPEPGLDGFVMLREGPPPDCVGGARPIELARLYTRVGGTSRGVGSLLMHAAKADARGRGFRTLWLGVWEHNHGARRFYARHGFIDVGAHDFLLGADPQTDRLLACAL
jgi:GNAT superfamily N-acetyltransferase